MHLPISPTPHPQKGFYAWVSGVTDNAVYPVLFLEYLQARGAAGAAGCWAPGCCWMLLGAGLLGAGSTCSHGAPGAGRYGTLPPLLVPHPACCVLPLPAAPALLVPAAWKPLPLLSLVWQAPHCRLSRQEVMPPSPAPSLPQNVWPVLDAGWPRM